MHSNAMNTNAVPRNRLGKAAHCLGEEQRSFLRQQHGMVIRRLPINSESASAPEIRATGSVLPASFPVHGRVPVRRKKILYPNEPHTPQAILGVCRIANLASYASQVPASRRLLPQVPLLVSRPALRLQWSRRIQHSTLSCTPATHRLQCQLQK